MKKILVLLSFFTLNILYAQVPAYYSSIDFTQTGENLKSQLVNLISSTHTTYLPYTSSNTTDTWDALKQGDLNTNNTNNVLLIYGWNDNDGNVDNDYSRDKNASCHVSNCSGLWVREHVFARSLANPALGFENAGADAHNLRAIDNDRNNMRANRKFEDAASSSASSITNAGNWYPGEEWKGDIARIIMYMYLRYGNRCLPTAVGAGPATYSALGDMPNVFLEWNAQDPVSEYEMNRNNTFQAMQGNRNPFIDNPYIATVIWNGPTAFDTWNGLNVKEDIFEDIYIYPTLTTDRVNIKNIHQKTYTYSIFNSFGQLIIQNNANSETIDISNQSKGMYFINLNIENQSKTFKVILN
jgi:endonuclease I